MLNSIGIMKYHGVYGSGATLRISREVERATQPLRSVNSVTELSRSNAPPVPILDEIYLLGGKLNVDGRKLMNYRKDRF